MHQIVCKHHPTALHKIILKITDSGKRYFQLYCSECPFKNPPTIHFEDIGYIATNDATAFIINL